MITPRYYTIKSGRGEGSSPLVAFDNALLNAEIGDYNLVRVSSILPPNCCFKESIDIKKGSVVFAAYAQLTIRGNETGSTAVGIALPANNNENGVIFEVCSHRNDADRIVRKMCTEAMNNRNRRIIEIISSSMIIEGAPGKYVCGVSAVVMW